MRVAPLSGRQVPCSLGGQTVRVRTLDSIARQSAYGVFRAVCRFHDCRQQRLDGADAPMKGDPGVTSVSVKMIGKNTLEETDKRAGKVIGVFKMKVAADGKSAKASYNDKESNETTDFHLTKQ